MRSNISVQISKKCHNYERQFSPSTKRRGEEKKNKVITNATYKTTTAQTKEELQQMNRLGTVSRNITAGGGVWGSLNQFYSRKTSPLILMQLKITNVFGLHRNPLLYLWNIAVKHVYSRNSIARTPLGPWRFNLVLGRSSNWGLIIAPGQEANGDNLEMSFRSSIK